MINHLKKIFPSQKAQQEPKILARVDHYEVIQTHPETYIVRDSVYGLHYWCGVFTAEFQLPQLLKKLEKTTPPPIKTIPEKRPVPKDENPVQYETQHQPGGTE